jgi:hypothetical protein
MTIAPGTAAAGSYTVTVTGAGPGGKPSHTATVALTVTVPPTNDFSMSAVPNAMTLAQGASGNSIIGTAITSGSAQTVTLSTSVSPAGPTASLNLSSISSGSSATLTVNAGSAAAGSYTVTVTGTGPGGAPVHSTTVTLTVTQPTGGGIVNGGFEAGSLSGWTSVGATAISTAAHSGSSSAKVGSSSPFNGDSSISQTFSAPAAGGTLSFWYNVVCTDTVTYDWATATLKDNTTGATSTVLAKTCTNTNTWKNATSTLVGGHSYTLTLIDHDDNYASDPTYTLYDDVAILAPPPPSPLVNGGFEAGALTGWTSAGAAAVTTASHSGTYAAQVGSKSPFNGDSSISQTFSPSANGTLSFWYMIVCTDVSVTYDWGTATLKDNTTGTTSTVVAKACTNGSTWLQASAAVTAGHSYTLTLSDHDDNFATDPTYTLFDDVAVQ